MTAPSIIKRRLTFHFERSVNAVTGRPNTMEVVVGALSNPTSAVTNTTFVDDPQSQTVVLGDVVNACSFDLVPSDDPSLSERILYRASWRSSYLGKQYSYDFAMPDRDVDFDDLFGDLSSIMDWHVYLQQSDLGAPGRVAKLNLAGQVVDAAGVPITGQVAAAVVQNNLDAEVVNRQKADRDLRTALEGEISSQFTSVLTTQQANLDRVIEDYQSADASERATRLNQVGQINSAISALQSGATAQGSQLESIASALPGKADLDQDGKLLTSQLPAISLGRAVPVADEAAMLALTSLQVQPGDFAVRPDGVYYLNDPDPHLIGSWVKFTVAPLVTSINGHSGAVTIAASDVGARPAGVALPISDITGLQTALDAKATTASVTALAGRVTGTEGRLTAIESPTSAYVRTANGYVPTTLLGADVPRVSGQNVLVNSQGIPISIIGSGAVDSVNGHVGIVVLGATDVGARPANTAINIAEVSGLSDALTGKVGTGDSRLTDSRTPTSHASSHAANGSDPITPAAIGARAVGTNLAISEVTGLQTALDSKSTTATSTQQATRIYSLETRVDQLEGQGGFGGISAFKVQAFDAPGRLTPVSVAAFANDVVLKTPFGKAADTGGYYYDPTGTVAGESVWPYITPNGHLELRVWNEAAPPDDDYATASEVSALQTAVNGKADSATVTGLSQAIDAKANSSDLTALSGTVAGLASSKADVTALTALTSTVAGKASQSSVDTLSGQLAAKASQASLDSLTTTVGGKAASSDLSALTTRVGNVETGKANTADLTALTSRVSAVETGKASTVDLATLSSTVAGKADTSALAAKENTSAKNQPNGYAGLDSGGKIASSQIPAVAMMNPQAVANRAAMLALTTAQVQQGDICTITGTTDIGTYILTATDPSVWANWLKMSTPGDSVSSVNGQVGTVVLAASDVGARPTGVSIAQSEVTGLPAALALKADEASVVNRLTSRPAWSVASNVTLEAVLSSAAPVKMVADYATAAGSGNLSWPLSGPLTVDGTAMTTGKVVLVNNQADSTQNGLWVANAAGLWTRSTDMTAGNYLVKGTLVLVKSGTANANTFWQTSATTSSGIVGTAANNWTMVMQAGPPAGYTAGNGLQLSGLQFATKLAPGIKGTVNGVVTSGGITATANGIAVDRTVVPNKFAGDVPPGNTLATVNHNLGTTDICSVTVIEKSSGDVKLLGWTLSGPDNIVLEFANAPGSGQYRCIVSA